MAAASVAFDTHPNFSKYHGVMKKHFPILKNPLRMAACLAFVWGTGCGDRVMRLDREDRSTPLVQRAEASVREGDPSGAVELYRQALDANPLLARAHLDLAIQLHDHDLDLLHALYHYDRYLELRPDTDKKAMIQGRIRLAKQSFAAAQRPRSHVPAVPTTEARESAARLLELRQENDRLQRYVESVEEKLEETRLALRKAQAKTADTGADPVADSGAKRYTVESGDTLSGIAVKFYGDAGRWQAILDANRQKLGGKSRVRVGQELVIP